ncbi:MAG: hypothetical protein V1742_10555 [Pseudomonadota bacterium]
MLPLMDKEIGLLTEMVRHSRNLVILNATPTPYDDYAHLVIRGPSGSVLSTMIKSLDRSV